MNATLVKHAGDSAPAGHDRRSVLGDLATMLPTAAALVGILTLLCGVIYPLLILFAGQILFPRQAAGSLVKQDGRVIGSALIGQSFSAPDRFWGRPSATAPEPYNAAASGGSNLGPDNPALSDAIHARIVALRALAPLPARPIPIDLVTASGSGLDPDISVAAARFQVPRIARLRRAPPAAIDALVRDHVTPRWLGLLGEPRVNVLGLNQALDRAFSRVKVRK